MTNNYALRYIGMITITDITQRVFFTPRGSLDGVVDICFDPPIWLLQFGVFSFCGVWDDEGIWKFTPELLQVVTTLTDGAGVEVKSEVLNFDTTKRSPSIAIEFFDDVPDDDYTITLTLLGDIIFESRVKILRQFVNRIARNQPVTTRKVNRTVSI